MKLDTGNLVKTALHEGLAVTQPACLGIKILSGLFGRPCSRVVNHSGFAIRLTWPTFLLLHDWVDCLGVAIHNQLLGTSDGMRFYDQVYWFPLLSPSSEGSFQSFKVSHWI